MSKLEHCKHCDDTTGRAGIQEDSLYAELADGDLVGPYCESCYSLIIETEKRIADELTLAIRTHVDEYCTGPELVKHLFEYAESLGVEK